MKVTFTDNVISKNDEKMVLINLIGIFEALKRDILSIDEAEKILFSPHMVAKLRMKGCDEKILDILERGCELEDIVSLIPDKILKTINELENMALELVNVYPNFNMTFWFE